ncbi:MAG: anaphase promoting complex subunit cdc16 [Cirrosporium novae-zelandiae]|nr:MAG: anaphase promoting complex subunit cdc16 [Cirrosporium novae-zelandiae]
MTMERFLREWRQDALNKHQYESAIYIGDKLLALTDDEKDAFWLAQVHFSTGNYTRAQGFLMRNNLIERSVSCRYLAAHCYIKQGKFDDALNILGDKNPTHLISSSSNSRRKLQHGNAKYLTLRNAKSHNSRLDRAERSEEREKADMDDIKFEAAMCYLRGICYAKQNAFDRARDCYKDAVRIDVQCFEAFDQLMKNSLMSPDEEWEFLESLDFDSINVSDDISASQEAAQFTKMLYTTRLSKYKNSDEFSTAVETLSSHYNLASNPDLLLSKAELLFTQCQFKEALAITESILETDKYNFNVHPLHLACLHELREKNSLFLIAHDLADQHPEEPCSWLAVGIYYLTIGKIAEARRYFSKSSMMDPHFGPAWIGFAHTFAAEGEHDQAISAYSTAARLFQGTHLPQLFLGMQNLQLNNLTLAQEYLNAAHSLCQTDPLLLNELGVVFYHQDHLDYAISIFKEALNLATSTGSDPRAWVPTRANLGHAYRRQGQYDLALNEFGEVLRQTGKDAGIFSAKGLCLLEMGRTLEAVVAFHEALAISPQDGIATELLGKALEEEAARGEGSAKALAGFGLDAETEESVVEGYLKERKNETFHRLRKGRETNRRGTAKGRQGGRTRTHGGGGLDGDDGSMMVVASDDD